MSQRYITITEGEDYRTIAAKMTKRGFKMNHATARNILLHGIKKLMMLTAKNLGQEISEEACKQLARRQDIHELVGDILVLCTKEEANTSCQVEKLPQLPTPRHLKVS